VKECFRIFPDLPGPFFRFVAMVPLTGYTKRTRFVNVLFFVHFRLKKTEMSAARLPSQLDMNKKRGFPSPVKRWKGLAEPS